MSKKGIWIPGSLMNDKNLDWPNRVLLAEIYSLMKLKNGCIASNQHFGDLLGINKSAASKRISWLESMGYITCTDIFKNRVCIGRSIKKGGSLRNNTVVPKEQGGSSRKTRGVVPTEQGGSSTGNPINTSTNTDILIQKQLHTGGKVPVEKIKETTSGKPIPNHFLYEARDAAVINLTGATIIGAEILSYSHPNKHKELLDRIGNIQFDQIEWELYKYDYAIQQLEKNNSSSTGEPAAPDIT